jgi:two-component system LytT family response regulator
MRRQSAVAEIRALIVDDEPLARRGIRQLLAPYADMVIVGECRDGREALRALATVKPDLVFLDVQMPGLDGLGVIRVHGAERMPMTVFVTAHDVRGAGLRGAGDRLPGQAISETVFAQRQVRSGSVNLIAICPAFGAARHEAARSGPSRATGRPGGHVDRRADRAAGASMRMRSTGSKRRTTRRDSCRTEALPSRESLAALEARLDPARFVRVHRSAIVRLDQVREWKAGGSDRDAVVVLRDGTELPVSRRRLAEVKSLLRPPGKRP